MKPITSANDLPARYPGSSHPMPNPRFDWCYIQEVGKALRGGVFLDSGTITNAEHARRRLSKLALCRITRREQMSTIEERLLSVAAVSSALNARRGMAVAAPIISGWNAAVEAMRDAAELLDRLVDHAEDYWDIDIDGDTSKPLWAALATMEGGE